MRRFTTVFLVIFSAWWLLYPVAQANKGKRVNAAQITVLAKPKPSNMQHLRKGKRLVIPVNKITSSNNELVSMGRLVRDYRKKLEMAEKTADPIKVQLHLKNKNKNAEVVEVELIDISSLGQEYLRIEVGQSSDFSGDFLTNQNKKLLVESVEFDR